MLIHSVFHLFVFDTFRATATIIHVSSLMKKVWTLANSVFVEQTNHEIVSFSVSDINTYLFLFHYFISFILSYKNSSGEMMAVPPETSEIMLWSAHVTT